MTVHVLPVSPPRPGLVLRGLSDSGPLSEAEAADLYGAMVADTVSAVAESGGDLLVNYPPEDSLPEEHRTDTSPEAELRAVVADVLPDADDTRFEPQVGSTPSARAGNAVSYLLRQEDEASVAVLAGVSPTLGRTDLDGAAMQLRRHGLVLGPAPGGRVSYAGFSDPIDFEDAFAPPALVTLARRGRQAGADIGFIGMHPRIETEADLVSLRSVIEARRLAGRHVPAATERTLDDLGLGIEVTDGRCRIVR